MPDRMESAERRGLDMSEKYEVDSLGDKCPVPVVKAKKALDKAMPGDVIEVHVDNDIAVQNLRKLASNMQCSSVDRQLEAKHFVVEITAGEAGGGRETTGRGWRYWCFSGRHCRSVSRNLLWNWGQSGRKTYLVAVASDTMGGRGSGTGEDFNEGISVCPQSDGYPS